MPVPLLALLHVDSVPVGHSPLPILAFNCASTGIGISAFWFSTSMGTVHYRHWHSIMVPVQVLAFLHLGSVPVLAHTITGTGIQIWCPYQYWHCCTMVQFRYGHSLLLVLVFNFAYTSNGISALWFSTSIGTVHYPHWHSKMVPVPVLAFLHFGSVPVWAHSNTGTGIQKWFQYQYWIFCILVHYQYWHGSLLVLAFNGARFGIGILALWFSTRMGTFHYQDWHLILPVPVMGFMYFSSVPV
jgi:hypothetical protein